MGEKHMKKTIREKLRAVLAVVLACVIALTNVPTAQVSADQAWSGTWDASDPLVNAVKLYDLSKKTDMAQGTAVTSEWTLVNDAKAADGTTIPAGTIYQAGDTLPQLQDASAKLTLAPLISDTDTNISKSGPVRVLYTFSIPNGYNLTSATTYQFTVPKEVALQQDVSDLPLSITGIGQVATVSIPKNSTGDTTGTVTFNGISNGLLNRNGAFYVDSQFSNMGDENTTPVTIPFEAQGLTAPITVTVNFQQPDPTVSKTGSFDSASSTIHWTVLVNANQTTLNNGSIEDLVPTGLTYTPGTFKVTDNTSGNVFTDPSDSSAAGGDISQGDFTYTQSSRTLRYQLPASTSDSYTVTYDTYVPSDQYGKAATNTASLYYNDKTTPVTSSYTVTPSPNYIQKTGTSSVTADGRQQITWKIPFNNDGGTLHNVVITDSYLNSGTAAPDGSAVVANSVKYYATDGSGTVTTLGTGGTAPSYTDDGSTLTATLGTVTGAQTLEFTVEFPADYLQVNQSATYKNTATLTASDNTYLSGGVSATDDNGNGVGVSNSMLGKTGTPDYSNGTINWTVTVNKSGRTMPNASLTDTIGDGHDYLPGTFKVYDSTAKTTVYQDTSDSTHTGDITASDTGYAFQYTQSSKQLVFTLTGSTSDTYTVTYTTKLDADQYQVYAGQTSGTYKNDATLQTDLSDPLTVTTLNPTPSVTYKNTVLKKAGAGFDYDTASNHDLTWKITVNPNQYPLTGVIVTDTLNDSTMAWQNPTTGDPAYAFDFDADQPVELYIGNGSSVNLTADSSSTPAVGKYYYDSASRKLTFNLGDLNDPTAANRTQVIQFKIKLVEPVDQYFKNNSTPLIKNTASVTSTENPNTVSATGQQKINNTVVGKTVVYSANQKYIDWNVQIDQNSVNLGTGISLSDYLQSGLLLDTNSVRLYAQTQDASSGNLTPDGTGARNTDASLTGQTALSLDTAQIQYDVDTNLFTFTMPTSIGSVNAPYLLTFRTYIDTTVITNGTLVSNSITLKGQSSYQQNSGSANATYTQNVGGYATGVTGQVTLKKTDSTTSTALAGATFSLYDQFGNHLRDVTTAGSDGSVVLPYLAFNVPYRLVEKSAPTGYQNNNTADYWFKYVGNSSSGHIQQVTADSGHTDIGAAGADSSLLTLTFSDALKTADVTFTKQGDGGAGLSGARFTLSGKALNGNTVSLQSNLTGSDGKVTFTDVPYSDATGYTVTETTIPSGYLAITPITGVQVDDTTAGTGVYTLAAQTDDSVGSLTITKYGSNEDENTLLSGAVFRLQNTADSSKTYLSSENQTGVYTFGDIPLGTYTLTETTPPTGYTVSPDQTVTFSAASQSEHVKSIVIHDVKQTAAVTFTKQNGNGAGLAGAQFGLFLNQTDTTPLSVSNTTDSTGTVTFSDVPYTVNAYAGGYWVKEITTPANFTAITPFQITTVDGALNLGVKDDAVRTANVTFKKTDGLNPLGGATFTLTGTAADGKAVLISAVSDTTTGIVTFENVPYSTGVYTVSETGTPAAHKQAADFTFSLNDTTDAAGTNLQLSDVVDVPLGSITVQKQDAGSGTFLAGAAFAVKSSYDGKTYTSYTTNSDGSVTFANLPLNPDADTPTDFTVVEVTTPQNYETGSIGAVELTNKDGQRDSLLIPFPNQRKLATVTLKKTDATGAPLAGAEFTLFDSATDQVVSAGGTTFVALSGQNGTVVFSGVPYGDYYIRETGVPADYTGDTAVKIPVKLDDDNTAIVSNGTSHSFDAGTVSNTLKTGTVELVKTDGIGAPLAGATFVLSGKSTAGEAVSQTFVSGADGKVTFTNVPYGSYTVRETAAPTNYNASGSAISVALHDSNANIKDGTLDLGTVQNGIKTGTLYFIKQNEYFDPLVGAEFTLSNDSGWSATAVSGQDGTVQFVGVPYGKLTLAETNAPAGYCTMRSITIDFTESNTALQNGTLDTGSYVDIPGGEVLDELIMRQRAKQIVQQREAEAKAAAEAEAALRSRQENPATSYAGRAWPAVAASGFFAALGVIPFAAGRARKRKKHR